MKAETIFKQSILAASIAMLTACSGGSDTSSSNTAGTSSGVVTGFGSIYVNGVEYETANAIIDIDGVSSQETSLGVGDVVVLKGSVNADGTTGTATAVYCTDELEGYVLDVSGLIAGVGTMNIMGQTVNITLETVFESDSGKVSISDLLVSDIVEVSGFSDGLGNITATRIETKNAATDVEIKGTVSSLSTVDMTFTIGGLTVDYSEATEIDAALADGLYVEVKTDQGLSGTTMLASKVEVEEDGDMDIDGDEGEELKVQGVISEVTDTSFRFNGTLVLFDSFEIDEDFNLALLTNGVLITVEGYINANGDFVVKKIEKDHESEDRADGIVTAKDATTVTITLSDTTSKTFTVNNSTRMIDEKDEGVVPLHYFSLADVATGEYVEIEFYINGDTNVATELKREDAPR